MILWCLLLGLVGCTEGVGVAASFGEDHGRDGRSDGDSRRGRLGVTLLTDQR